MRKCKDDGSGSSTIYKKLLWPTLTLEKISMFLWFNRSSSCQEHWCNLRVEEPMWFSPDRRKAVRQAAASWCFGVKRDLEWRWWTSERMRNELSLQVSPKKNVNLPFDELPFFVFNVSQKVFSILNTWVFWHWNHRHGPSVQVYCRSPWANMDSEKWLRGEGDESRIASRSEIHKHWKIYETLSKQCKEMWKC